MPLRRHSPINSPGHSPRRGHRAVSIPGVLLFCISLSLFVFAPPAREKLAAQETVQGSIKVVHPWVYETTQHQSTLHLTITNTGARTDHLIRAATPIAAIATISDLQRTVTEHLTIPGRAELAFGKSPPSIELFWLTQPLKANERFSLLLVFDRAGKVKIDVEVVPSADR